MQGEAGEPTSETRVRLEAEGRGFPNLSRIPTPNAGGVNKVLPNTGGDLHSMAEEQGAGTQHPQL